MNWLTSVVRPKIRSLLRREVPENLWVKCPETGQMVFYKDLEANQFVIPGSNYHMRMGAKARLKVMFDGETWIDVGIPAVPVDPLKFRDERRYVDRLKDARTKTGLNDAIKLGFGKLDGLPVVIGVQDFDFMGGSLGMQAGEAFLKGAETALDKRTPYILFAASGGARPRIMSAAFSASISTEALRLADGMVGMIEASITRRLSSPRTRSWSSTTAVRSLSGAIRQVPMRWNVVVPRCLAAVIRSSSDWACTPGNSSRS